MAAQQSTIEVLTSREPAVQNEERARSTDSAKDCTQELCPLCLHVDVWTWNMAHFACCGATACMSCWQITVQRGGFCPNCGLLLVRSPEQQVKQLITRCEKGSGQAAGMLGSCFEHGYGVDSDLERAAEYFALAAERNDAHGLQCLAVCAERGECGVPRDLLRAVDLYRRAAEKGHVDALYNYGMSHIEGLAIDQSWDKGAHFIRMAAERGSCDA